MKRASVVALLLCLVQGFVLTHGVTFDEEDVDQNRIEDGGSVMIFHDEIDNTEDPTDILSSLIDNIFEPPTERNNEDMQLMLADEANEAAASNVVNDSPASSTSATDSTPAEETATTVLSEFPVESPAEQETRNEDLTLSNPINSSNTSDHNTTTEIIFTTTESEDAEISENERSSTTEVISTTAENEDVDSFANERSSTTEVISTTAENEDVESFANELDSTNYDTEPTTTEISPDMIKEESERKNKEFALKRVNKLSDQIRLVLQQYKKTKTVKILDIPIPDPMHIPDMTNRYSLGTINFKDMKVYGLSNFTVKHINTDLDKMQAYVMLKMERLVVIGNYSMRSWISRAAGPFSTVMLNVTTEGAAELQRNEAGELEASESDMDMSFEDVHLDFKNLGLMGSFFQSIMGSVASFLFDGMKPVILSEVNTNLRADVNKKLKTMATQLKLADMNPVDQAVMEGRRYVREQGYDPYFLKNYTRDFGLITLNITNFKLRGLSRFYRVGEIPFSMDSGVVEAGLHVATDRLNGSCVWSVGIGRTALRNGSVDFSTEHFQIRGIVRQSLDLTEQPLLHDLDILLGRLELKTERIDTLDYIVEAAVNRLPSLLRHIIVDGLEDPIKFKVQGILNEVDVQAIVNDTLPAIDNFGV